MLNKHPGYIIIFLEFISKYPYTLISNKSSPASYPRVLTNSMFGNASDNDKHNLSITIF
jgi:hypothetical protein